MKKKNELTKQTRKALRTIRTLIDVNIDIANCNTEFHRSNADIAQHELNNACTDSDETRFINERDDHIRRANVAIMKLQKLYTLRSMFDSFAADFNREIIDH